MSARAGAIASRDASLTQRVWLLRTAFDSLLEDLSTAAERQLRQASTL